MEEEKLLMAINKNEVMDYIRGVKGYMTIPKDNLIAVPKEGEGNFYYHILKYGFLKLNDDYPSLNASRILLDSLNMLLDTDSLYDLYCSYNMAYYILSDDVEQKLNFSSEELQAYLTKLNTSIKQNMAELKEFRTYGGNVSMYEYFNNLSNILTSENNKKIL